MSYVVQRAIWEHWHPCQQVEIAEDDPQLDMLIDQYRWGMRHEQELSHLLLALAVNANPITSDAALTFTSQDKLAAMIRRTDRHVRTLLSFLHAWRDIEMRPCDGRCAVYHGRTKHIVVFRPPAAELWDHVGDRATRQRAKRLPPAKAKATR